MYRASLILSVIFGLLCSLLASQGQSTLGILLSMFACLMMSVFIAYLAFLPRRFFFHLGNYLRIGVRKETLWISAYHLFALFVVHFSPFFAPYLVAWLSANVTAYVCKTF
ncbi:MAG: hypothetical protein CL920_13680 [Deltaproteobacteria bacterium]|nr:hypothetical protein [Deltaproteobacteria bacterium]MBU49741.1 hypothetical protein [Deltaproteobacteria bacterium]